MLANPLAKYAVMNPIFAPNTHPIQPNTVETTIASRFFNNRPPFVQMLPGRRPFPRLPVPWPTSPRVEGGHHRPVTVGADTGNPGVPPLVSRDQSPRTRFASSDHLRDTVPWYAFPISRPMRWDRTVCLPCSFPYKLAPMNDHSPTRVPLDLLLSSRPLAMTPQPS